MRKLRILAADAWYHVSTAVNNREPLFWVARERARFERVNAPVKTFRKRQSKQPLQQLHIVQPHYKPAPQKTGKYATVRVFARPVLQSSAPSPVTSSFFERLSN
jgi:hypothetical protein